MGFYIRLLTTLVPFLWEMMFGKEASIKETLQGHKKVAVLFIAFILSLCLNVWLGSRVVNISAKYVRLQNATHLESQQKPNTHLSSPAAVGDNNVQVESAFEEIAAQEKRVQK